MVERIFEMFALMQTFFHDLWSLFIEVAKTSPKLAIFIAVWFFAPAAYAIAKRRHC